MARRPIIILLSGTKIAFIVIGLILLISAGFTVVSAFSNHLKDKVIIIDAGHGGQDPGAQYGGIKEKDLNLDIAFRLQEILTAKGCKAIMTREEDKDFFLPNFVLGRMAKRAELNERIRLATTHNANLFISIHANSFPGGNSYGMESYYNSQSATGKRLAESIHSQLLKIQPDNRRRAKPGDYYLLSELEIPSVLIEVGFLSNTRERRLLQDDRYKTKIAEAIADGIDEYFSQ